MAAPSRTGLEAWNHPRFFELLTQLSPLRVISRCAASTFEAILCFDPPAVDGRFMNAITPAYHWHLDLAGFRHVRARDEQHARSGRRVLFFELRSDAGGEPFLWIYLHRERGADFEVERERRFCEALPALAPGMRLAEAARA